MTIKYMGLIGTVFNTTCQGNVQFKISTPSNQRARARPFTRPLSFTPKSAPSRVTLRFKGKNKCDQFGAKHENGFSETWPAPPL